MNPYDNSIDTIDTIKFIKLVEEHAILYDRKSEHFTSEPQKLYAWKTISQECKCSASDCMTKWMMLRQKFVREKEKEVKLKMSNDEHNLDTSKSNWEIMELMRFMEPHVTLRIPSTFEVRGSIPQNRPSDEEWIKEETIKDDESVESWSCRSQLSVTQSNASRIKVPDHTNVKSISYKPIEMKNPNKIIFGETDSTNTLTVNNEPEASSNISSPSLTMPKKTLMNQSASSSFQRKSNDVPVVILFTIKSSRQIPLAKQIALAKQLKRASKLQLVPDVTLKKSFGTSTNQESLHCVSDLRGLVQSLENIVQNFKLMQEKTNLQQNHTKPTGIANSWKVLPLNYKPSLNDMSRQNPDELFGRLVAAEISELNDPELISQAKMLVLKLIYKLRLGESVKDE